MVSTVADSREDAEDLTQEFFARLLSRDLLQSVDRGKGRGSTSLDGRVIDVPVVRRARALLAQAGEER